MECEFCDCVLRRHEEDRGSCDECARFDGDDDLVPVDGCDTD